MHYAYPATLEPEGEGFSLWFEGLPGATWGKTRDEAMAQGRDLLVSALEMLADDGEALPAPPAAFGKPVVEVEL